MVLLKESLGADFSPDRNKRYSLWRIWDTSKPIIAFIGLNPSTANEITDDPTIRRVRGFAKKWGYGGFYMLNLFTMVTPYPKNLDASTSADLSENNFKIHGIISKCKEIVFAWGNFQEAIKPGAAMAETYPFAKCLGQNKNGSPKHPLYMPLTTELIPFVIYGSK